jgi:hypothetical protein
MQQPDELMFEALPQRIDANKNKRRRKDTPAAAAAAPADVAGSSAGAAADSSTADCSTAAAKAAEAVAAAAAAGSLNAGFGFHNMDQQQQPGSQEQQEAVHVENPEQYRSAAVGQHKFECESNTPWNLAPKKHTATVMLSRLWSTEAPEGSFDRSPLPPPGSSSSSSSSSKSGISAYVKCIAATADCRHERCCCLLE